MHLCACVCAGVCVRARACVCVPLRVCVCTRVRDPHDVAGRTPRACRGFMQSRSYNQLLVAAGKKFDVPESTCLAESKIKTEIEIRGAE